MIRPPPLPRILFVDDEPRVLEGLSGSLWRMRRVWDMTFICGGPEAVEALAANQFEAVVTDMRMPTTDGEGVLRAARDSNPGAIRVILSGQTDRAVTLRAATIAHQFLTKPCNPDELRTCLGRLLELGHDMGPEVRAFVCAVGQVPVCGKTHRGLDEIFAGDVHDLDSVARCAEMDPALAAKFIHVSGAGFFAPRQRIGSLDQALAVIGLDAVRMMVSTFTAAAAAADARLLLWQRHTQETCDALARTVDDEDSRLCGILHSLGKRVLLDRFGADYAELLERAREPANPGLDVLERERFGVAHDEIAGHLVRLWGVSERIALAIRHHADPSRVASPSALTLALHAACASTGGAARLHVRTLPAATG